MKYKFEEKRKKEKKKDCIGVVLISLQSKVSHKDRETWMALFITI